MISLSHQVANCMKGKMAVASAEQRWYCHFNKNLVVRCHTVLTRLEAVTSLQETPLGLIRKWSCSLLTLSWRKDMCSQW